MPGYGSRELDAVTDVRHALSSLLGDSSPEQANRHESNYSKVCRNLDVIEEYRSKGHSLAAIHSALKRSDILQCTLHTFRHYYYTRKASLASGSKSAKEGVQSQSESAPDSSLGSVTDPSTGLLSGSESEDQTDIAADTPAKDWEDVPDRLFRDDTQTDVLPGGRSDDRGNSKLKKITCTDEIKRAYDQSQELFAARCRELSGE